MLGSNDNLKTYAVMDWDWNFDGVPDHELIACCLWEYARESETIARVCDVHWCQTRKSRYKDQYKRDPYLASLHAKKEKIIKKQIKASAFDYNAFSEAYWTTDCAMQNIFFYITRYVTESAPAWQKLSEVAREILLRSLKNDSILQPCKPASLEDLEALWEQNSKELLEVRREDKPPNDDTEMCMLFEESQALNLTPDEGKEISERVTVAFTVDFSRFTDKEISEEFTKWLKSARPKAWQKPRRVLPDSPRKGGSPRDTRVALERLGLMRLLHWHSPTELCEYRPDAWASYKTKEQDFRREIRQACKVYQRLFPFLPEDELPRSVERYGVWTAEMNRIMDKLDEDTGGTK